MATMLRGIQQWQLGRSKRDAQPLRNPAIPNARRSQQMTPPGVEIAPNDPLVAYFLSAPRSDHYIVAQVQSIARANDPIYEVGFRLGGAKAQEKIWMHVLMSLAECFQVYPPVRVRTACIDPRVQWSQAGNVWQNAAMRSALAMPLRIFRRLARRTTTSTTTSLNE